MHLGGCITLTACAVCAAVSESGTVGDWPREELEMFCLSHIIYCMMDIDTENIFIDWRVASNPDGALWFLQVCASVAMVAGYSARSHATMRSCALIVVPRA
jgi:hypothetical protein